MTEKILIVEDEKNMQKTLYNLLSRYYEVTAASNGLDAKEKLRRESFDMVITDLRMRPWSGKKLIEYVHKEDIDVINIIITGHPNDWTPISATDQHVFYYFKKGEFKPSDLIRVVKNGLTLRKLRIKNRQLEQEREKLETQMQIKSVVADMNKLREKLCKINSELQDIMKISRKAR